MPSTNKGWTFLIYTEKEPTNIKEKDKNPIEKHKEYLKFWCSQVNKDKTLYTSGFVYDLLNIYVYNLKCILPPTLKKTYLTSAHKREILYCG